MYPDRADDERRFSRALVVSLLAHALILGYVKGVEPLRQSGSGGPLTVRFLSQRAAIPPPAEADAARARLLLQPRPEKPAPPLPAPKPKPVPPSSVMSQQRVPGAARVVPGSADNSRVSTNRGPGVVDVLLVIGADGHPRGIYWDKLPALTKAQFEQLEAVIRRQVYSSMDGARITQEVDVFALLAMPLQAPAAPPAPRQEAPSTSAPE